MDLEGFQQSQYHVVISKVCDRRSILNAPTFRVHCEYKQPEDEDECSDSSIATMNGADVLLIKVGTLEKHENRSEVIGYSAINIIVNPDAKRQPNLLNFARCSIHVGAFRLPLFLEHPCKDEADEICCVSEYVDHVPKLFGASVMVRISLNDEEPMLEMLDDHEYDEAMCGVI